MQYHKPKFEFDIPFATQTQLMDKFGGLPWGFPQEMWPVCANCGNFMTHVMQLQHQLPRLGLGADGRVVFVFVCAYNVVHGCYTSDANAGANQVLVLESSQLTEGLTPLPDLAAKIDMEVLISDWEVDEDLVLAEQFALFFDEETLYQLPDKYDIGVHPITRLGGAPYWYQSASESPMPSHCFVGQFDGDDYDDWVNPSEAELAAYSERTGELNNISPENVFNITSVFADGLGYLFIDRECTPPVGKLIWQR